MAKLLIVLFFCFIILDITLFLKIKEFENQIKELHKISIPTPKLSLDQNLLWSLIQDWRKSENLPLYIKDQRLCNLAQTRLQEIKVDYSHNGFWYHTKDFKYKKLAENAAKDWSTESDLLSAWLSSTSHSANLKTNYQYSCLACEKAYCVQIFSNFEK